MTATFKNVPTIILVAAATSIASSAVTAIVVSRSPALSAATVVPAQDPALTKLLKSVKVDDGGNVTISGGNVSITGASAVKVRGLQITVQGDAQTSIQSGAQTSIGSGGQTSIKGTLVTIN